MVIEAYFRNAMDARFAISALRRIGAEPSDPIPVRPNEGRPFRVDIDLEAGSLGARHSKPVLVSPRGVWRLHDVVGRVPIGPVAFLLLGAAFGAAASAAGRGWRRG